MILRCPLTYFCNSILSTSSPVSICSKCHRNPSSYVGTLCNFQGSTFLAHVSQRVYFIGLFLLTVGSEDISIAVPFSVPNFTVVFKLHQPCRVDNIKRIRESPSYLQLLHVLLNWLVVVVVVVVVVVMFLLLLLLLLLLDQVYDKDQDTLTFCNWVGLQEWCAHQKFWTVRFAITLRLQRSSFTSDGCRAFGSPWVY